MRLLGLIKEKTFNSIYELCSAALLLIGFWYFALCSWPSGFFKIRYVLSGMFCMLASALLFYKQSKEKTVDERFSLFKTLNSSSHKKEKKIPKHIFAYSMVALVSIPAALVTASMFIGFDISDEGFNLYLLMHGNSDKPLFLNTYYTIFHNIGNVFGHSLLLYRLLSIVFILTSAVCVSIISFKYWSSSGNSTYALSFISAPVIFSFLFPAFIPKILSYYSLSSSMAYFWAAGAISYISRTERPSAKTIHAILSMSISIFFMATARPPAAACLVIATAIVIVTRKSKKFSSRAVDFMTFLLVLTIISVSHIYSIGTKRFFEIITLYKAESCFGHSALLSLYARQAMSFVTNNLYAIVGTAISYFFISYYSRNKNQEFFRYVSWYPISTATACAIILFLNSYNEMRNVCALIAEMLMTIFISSCVLYITHSLILREESKKMLTLTLVCWFAAIASCAGTNWNIFQLSGSGAIALFVVPVSAIINEAFEKRILSSFFVLLHTVAASVCVSLIVFHGPILSPFRCGNLELSRWKESRSEFLHKILIDPKLADCIDSLRSTLSKIRFDMEKDKILSINIPGIIAASGAQAFGMVWCCGSYKPYLDMENRNNTEKVYTLLKDDVFYDDLKQNFFSKLVKHENPPSTICIGTFSHYQDAHDNNTVSSLTLSGPYMLRD